MVVLQTAAWVENRDGKREGFASGCEVLPFCLLEIFCRAAGGAESSHWPLQSVPPDSQSRLPSRSHSDFQVCCLCAGSGEPR